MNASGLRLICWVLLVCCWCRCGRAQIAISQLAAPQLWQRLEFRITNVPEATNPFDPNVISLDATFSLPSGRTIVVPAFWYQGYQRGLSGGYEYVIPAGPPEWRLRFAPQEPGSYSLSLTVRTNGQYCGAATTNFSVPATPAPAQLGYVRVAPGGQYFQTADGRPLPLVGENVDWPTTGQGTYQYDAWFAALEAAGANYARMMMTPWAFGIETDTNTLTRYRLDSAWKLDYVLQLAEQHHLYVLLCLDIHLMFQPVPDYWGDDNYWQSNPYNATNGGPCLTQDAFFTNSLAQTIYQKRLRYLIARYGYSPNLVAWQLLSEIDNEYAYLTPANVPPWHSLMAGWLHTNDPFGHLVTTSLTGGSDRPEIWSLPQLDFAAYHSYAEPSPALRLSTVAQSFLQRYHKPVLIDEFGTDWRGWSRANDPFLRGFRQGLWGGALGGSAGTAMSWWWDSIDLENVYPLYTVLVGLLNRTSWGSAGWTNIGFQTAGAPPVTVGELLPGGQPFQVTLIPGGLWGASCSGQLAVPGPEAAAFAPIALNSFVLGAWFPTLRRPFALSAWLTNDAHLVLHINSVSDSAALAVRVDGIEMFSTNLPNLNGTGSNVVNNSYNLDLPVNLPAGKHLTEITNTAFGWVYLDWVRLEQVLPASYAGNWHATPEPIGLRGSSESLIYLIAPGVSFPGNATTTNLPVQHATTVTLTNWPTGRFLAEWYAPVTAAPLGLSQTATTNGNLTLDLPDYTEDLVGIIYPPPSLTALGLSTNNTFQLRFTSQSGGRYLIETSSNLLSWASALLVTNSTGTMLVDVPIAGTTACSFYRAQKAN